MLYNILNAFMPYAIACGIIGALMMFIRTFSSNLFKGKFSLIIIQTFFIAFIIGFYSLIPIFVSLSDILIIILIAILSTVLLVVFLSILFECEEDLVLFCIALLVIHIIFCILFSCLLYSDFKVTETKSEEIKLNSSKTQDICIINDIRLNNIPENINENMIKETINSIDTIGYWYLTENNEALYNNVLATDSVLVLEESNHYYLEIQSYVTISKESNKHKVLSITPTIRHVYVFHVPKEVIGI